jgi:hypothetical protein
MPEETPQTTGQTENPLVRYEHTDASFRWILAFVSGGLVVGVVIYLGVAWFMEGYRGHENTVKKSPFPLAPHASESLPAEPRLEQLDRLGGIDRPNVYKREAAKLRVLDSYGATEEQGHVHIPIKQAIELLVTDQKLRDAWLPSRPEPSADQRRRSEGLVDAGEPNSGRVFRGGTK